MENGEKRVRNGGIGAKAIIEEDDGYFRSNCNTPIDEIDSDESFVCPTSSSSGIDSSDEDGETSSDSTDDEHSPIKARIADNPKFNPGE